MSSNVGAAALGGGAPAGKAGAVAHERSDSAATARRLQSELMQLMVRHPWLAACAKPQNLGVSTARGSDAQTLDPSSTSADAGISAFPEGDNIFNWVGTIAGGAQTVYEGLKFKLTLAFPADYPFKAPTVRFDTPCFHPNVDQNGNICLDILKEKWSAVHNVRTVLLSIQSLLGEPNNESPLNGQAAALWANQEEFRRVLLERACASGSKV